MSAFEITKELVAHLADEPLRELLDRLITTEARKTGVPVSGIVVGGNQTAPDGGVDASVSWLDSPDPSDRLPRRKIYYQCKAQAMGPAEIGREMRPKGILRPIFAELAYSDGAYIIFSTDDVGTKGVDARITRMHDELAGLPDADRIHVDFYGADRIARWANQHPGIALWLLERSGRPRTGWRPYGNWSGASLPGAPYLLDEQARTDVAGDRTVVAEAVIAMRETLAQPKRVVRLVGWSGTGKTRLAEALFEERLGVGTALDPASAVYADAGLDLASSPAVVAEQLSLSGARSIMIIDNATSRLHSQLSEIVARPGSEVSLLTIDYGVEDDQPENTLLVRLHPSSEAVLLWLIEQRHPDLGRLDRERLARFCEGNARMGLAIARNGGDLAKLTDSELLDRLFQSRRQDDKDVRVAAEAASLVYAFFADKTWRDEPEHSVLAGIAGMPANRFYRLVQTMLDWGVAQQRGAQRAIKPDPIADRLAAKILRVSDPEALLSAFGAGPERLFASFARRLGRLHGSAEACRLAERLLRRDEWLGELSSQGSVQRRAFINIAPAAPLAALTALERALAGPDCDALVGSEASRRDIAELLTRIAHDAELFERAMLVLAVLARAEDPADRNHPARDAFLGRFQPRASLTLSDDKARHRLIERLLDDNDAASRMLGLSALDTMLDPHIRGASEPEFGTRLQTREWRPPNYADWIKGALNPLERLALSGEPQADRARDIIAHRMQQHAHPIILDAFISAVRRIRPSGYWDAGWRATTDTLHFPLRGGTADGRSKVVELERDLRPRALDELFDAFVMGEPWRHWHPSGREKNPSRNVGFLARAVGQKLVRSNVDLQAYLDRASVAQGQTSVFHFGEGLGRAARDLDTLWKVAYRAFERAEPTRRNLGPLAGILRGAEKRADTAAWAEAKLDAAAADPLLREYLVLLKSGRELGPRDARRFLELLDRDQITPARLEDLMYGGATKTLPPIDLALLLDRMIEHPDGAIAALQVLFMRVHGDRAANQPVAPELVAIGRKLLTDARCYVDERTRADHELEGLARLAFENGAGADLAVSICRTWRKASKALSGQYRNHDFDDLARVLMQLHPKVVLDEIVLWAKSENRRDLAQVFFGGWLIDADDRNGRELVQFELEAIKSWIASDAQPRAERLAGLVPYMQPGQDSSALTWTPVARLLIEAAADPLPVLRALEDRFSVGSGSGSFASRYIRRRPLVEEMLSHTDRRIRGWAREAMDRLNVNIAHMEALDRTSDSAFE
jgi:hypothetical protein